MPTARTHRRQKRPARRVRRWSGRVTRTSHAMDLEPGVFTGNNPKKIAASIKRSSDSSTHRKTSPYRSALSMITFYLNRGGRNLPASRKNILQRAKLELKKLYGREGSR